LDSEASGMGSDVTEDEESDNSDMSGDGTEEISGGKLSLCFVKTISKRFLRMFDELLTVKPGHVYGCFKN
jgi:hypothetical protein